MSIRFSLGTGVLHLSLVDVLFSFLSKEKSTKKEKSQPGSVAMLVLWLGRDCGCRNITNVARKMVFEVVVDSD
jgi:hypothetical protein